MAQREALTRQGLTGNVTPRVVVPFGAIPIPGFDAAYLWHANSAGAALTQGALGGALTLTYPSGGVLAVADSAGGVVALSAWWAYASQFTINRIETDGTRTPVRGAEGWQVTGGRSRRNLAAHPTNAAGDLVGWAAGTNTTLAPLTSLASSPDPNVTTGTLATATAPGSINVTFALDNAGTNPTTYGLWIAAGAAAPSSAAITVQWYDVNGSAVGTSSYPLAATGVSESALGWSWCQATISSFPFGAVFGVVGFTAAGMAAGATMSLTGRLWETGTTLGSYFDGSYFGANWAGTPLKSASTLAPVQLIVDAEAPLDVPIAYELTNAVAPGYVATSNTVLVPSDGFKRPYDTLLTHPGRAKTIPVWIEEEPDIDLDIDQTAFAIIGRRNKVVVSAPQRSGDEGTLTFIAESIGQRDELLAMLDDGSPLLIRSPAAYGHPPSWWLSFGKITKVAPGSKTNAGGEVRRLSAPFVQVDRPSVATRDLVA